MERRIRRTVKNSFSAHCLDFLELLLVAIKDMVMVDLVVLVVLEEDTIITIHPRMVILLTDHTAAATDHHMEEEDGISRVRRKVTP